MMDDQCLAEIRANVPHMGTCICRQRRYHSGQHGCAVCGHRWTADRPWEKYDDED